MNSADPETVPNNGSSKDAPIRVSVVLATPKCQPIISLLVWTGCTARQAVCQATRGYDPDQWPKLRHAPVLPRSEQLAFFHQMMSNQIDPLRVPLAIYGRSVNDDHLLVTGDRIELLRPLRQDPKEWRRQRAQAARKAPR